MITFGEKLRALRAETRLTQPDLAKKVGIEQSYLSKLENDKSVPSVEVFKSLSEIYQLSPEEMLINVDLNLIRRDFGHIPMLMEQIKQYDDAVSRYHQRWLVTTILLVVIGCLVFLLGQQSMLLNNITYNYKSENQLITHKKNEINKDIASYETLYRSSFEYKGPSYYEDIDHQKIIFGLESERAVSRWGNRVIMFIGILLFATGILAMLLEKRIHSPALSKG